jgi:RHS repeat-associated protein
MDNLVEMEEADGNIHHFEYNASGEMINAKDSLHEVSFEYGPMGVLKSRTQNSRRVRFAYDNELQLRSIVNEGGEEYLFELDALGRVKVERGFDGMEREYLRDGAGRVTKVLRPDDRWTSYVYDDAGNVLREEHHDGTGSAYAYNADGALIKASNEEGIIEFKRDKAGRTVEENYGGNSIKREYDKNGDCIRLASSLGADVRFDHDAEGNLQSMQAGKDWQAEWKRDRTGLELHRELTGGVSVRTERDRFGREIRKSVGVRNIEKTSRKYSWGIGNRLQSIHDEWTGKLTTFNYDAFDNLIKADYQENNQVNTIYRVPDAIGNLFEAPYRNDRKYDKGGRLTEDPNYFYYYDCEGNLIFKEFKKPQGYSSLNKAALQKKYDIRFKGSATGWFYEWSAGGMLERVVNPQQGKVTFGYDALGRRVYKEVKHTRTHWLWDGNVPLHEWQTTEKEPLIDIITWVFEEGSFVPTARITDRDTQSIVTDYLGTPVQMYDANGAKTWEADLDIYGRVRTFAARSLSDCPFRYQGQYQDEETGLYYNRFRYYDPSVGSYISQDPIGLAGGNPTLYGYVKDVNSWVDYFGLNKTSWTLTDSTGTVIDSGVMKPLPKAKSIDGRVGDSEQRILQQIGTKYAGKLEGTRLVINSEPTFIKVGGKSVPIPGISPCKYCDEAMRDFAKQNGMEIDYNYKGKTIHYH